MSDEDAEFDTDELPRLTASGAIASPPLAGTTTAPPSHVTPPDRAVKPGRGDHAAKRDRRAERRERAAQGERERAARAARERAAQEEAERERAREAELAARATKVLRERERAAREQDEQEAAAQAEREDAERAERQQAERERAARVQAERSARAQAEREQAEKAERERAERDRAARERERAANERAARAERERAAYEAKQERERAAQAERERAEHELEQARRERAERESAVPGKRATPPEANPDDTTRLIIAASTNGAATTNGAAKPDSVVEQDWAFGPDETAKPNGTAKPVQHRPAAARGDVLEHPRRMARQAPTRRRGRTIALVAAAAVVVVAGPVAVIMSRHTAAPPDGSGSGLRNAAATWISQQVNPSDVVSCDLAMCQALEANGVSTGDLLVMNSSDHNILSSQVVVSTSAIRHLFGSRLGSVYAPAVIASFGSGKAQIEVRVIAPHGSAAYMSQLNTDVQQRKTVGADLTPNNRIIVSATGKRQMDAGQVDLRLLVGLTYLLGASSPQQQLHILAFGDLGPGASPGVPLRAVYLAETGVVANVQSTLAALRSAQADFHPAHTETVRFDGKRALYIEFAAPPALGVITQ